jgi:hypothetical protein
MLRNIITLILLISISVYQNAFAINDNESALTIIPRASWWANSLYNDINSDYWKSILEARANYVAPYSSPENIAAAKEKTQKINNYLNENFSDQFSYQEIVKYKPDTDTEYAWDLKYTEYVDSIVVHHTHSEYDDDITGMNQIHKYHSLNRTWWDIWYNYIIWYDGVIYEWREWWDYVSWAHSTYNNLWTVWIAVLWNYESEWVNKNQYESLEALIQKLTLKYGIDLAKKRYYHMSCYWTKCDTFPIETYLDSVLIWHRDATHTTCPWEKLYEQIQQIRTDNLAYTEGFTPVARWEINPNTNKARNSNTAQIQDLLVVLNKYSLLELENILRLVDTKLEQELEYKLRKKLQIVRLAVVLSIW